MLQHKLSLQDKKVVILGAGPAGLSAGLSLSHLGMDVTILEKDCEVGGLCRSIYDNGYIFDYGPHIIHTAREDILSFFRRFLKDDLKKIEPHASIYFNGQFVTYPIKGIRAIKILNSWNAILALKDLILARVLMFLRDPKEEDSFKDWIINRFGKTLYNIYFGPYVQKTWKIPDTEISAYVAKRRVPVLSLSDYLRSLVKLKARKTHPEDGTMTQRYYPKHGVGQIMTHLEQMIIENGGKIIMNINLKEIRRGPKRFNSIVYTEDGKNHEIFFDYLISTIPINDFVLLIRPDVPQDVFNASGNLDYCSERILYIKVNKDGVFPSPLVYFQDPSIKFNRVYCLKKLGKECVPAGKEALCVEFTCSYEDSIWNASDEDIYNEVLSIFEKEKMLSHKSVDSYFTKKVTHAYPRFRINFQKDLNTIFSYLMSMENGMTIGRQGLFCYANMDEAIDMGFKAAEFINSMSWKNIDYNSLFKEYVHLEGF